MKVRQIAELAIERGAMEAATYHERVEIVHKAAEELLPPAIRKRDARRQISKALRLINGKNLG